MDNLQKLFDWRFLARIGFIIGLLLVYVGAVGMLEAFNERDVIRNTLTLGQVLLFVPVLVGGYYLARKQADRNPALTIVDGALMGLIASIPVVILVLLADPLDLRNVFVNVSRDLIEFLTFEAETVSQGVFPLVLSFVSAGAIGAVFWYIPYHIRRAVLTGAIVTVSIGMMSEQVSLILQENFSRELIDQFFRRRTLLPEAALGIFLFATGTAAFWSLFGGRIRDGYAGQSDTTKRATRGTGWTIFGIILLILPWIVGSFFSQVFNEIGRFVLMGLGLNIAVGLAGLLDLGYVTNFAVGAYIMGVLTSTGNLGIEQQAGIGFFNFWLVIPVSILVAMFTGFIFALPVLRMRGDYLAIATLGFGEIIGRLAESDFLRPIIGGAQGVLFIPNPSITIDFLNLNIEFKDPEQTYYIFLIAIVVMIFISIRLDNSRTGRQWMAIREDEDAASAMGIDTIKAKMLAFTLSAAAGGVSGAIFAAKLGTIFPNSFEVLVSINVLSLIIVGGMGSIPGVVVGAIVLIGLPEVLREFSDFRWLLYGALLVIMMLARPEGLWPASGRKREILSGRKQKPDEPDMAVSGDPTPDPQPNVP